MSKHSRHGRSPSQMSRGERAARDRRVHRKTGRRKGEKQRQYVTKAR